MSEQDQDNRLRAIDPTQSFCVSAPAGSGKTELLTQRLLALLARVNRPEQVLAITFTRKAASEMSSRVIEKLDQARRSTPAQLPHEATTRALAQSLLSHAQSLNWQLDESTLNIRTIDSFCHEITRQMPIVSGVGGISEAVDDATPLYEGAVNQLLAQSGGEDDTGEALRLLLHHFDNRWMRVRELLVSLLARRGDWAPHIGQHQDPIGAEAILFDSVSNLVRCRLEATRTALGGHFAELCEVIDEARETLGLPALMLTTDAAALEDWRSMADVLLTATGEWRKPGGISIRQGFEKGSEAKSRFLSLLNVFRGNEPLRDHLIEVRQLPGMQRHGQGWSLVVAVSSLLPLLQAHLLLAFQKKGVVDHTHIALAACDALGPDDSPSPIAERLDYQIEHILVDEFQDTAHSQAEFLRRLTRDWSDHNATGSAPRTLFVVGDPMQSIYGFRYADVALFMRIQKAGLSGLKLSPLTLTQNFRSRPAVIDWVNETFATLMGEGEDLDQGRVRHVNAIATRKNEAGAGRGGVSLNLYEEDTPAQEASSIAMQIEELRAARPEASIAILVRAKSHTAPILPALLARGIDFDGDALQSQAEQVIVKDLLSLCQWLENPADDVAALALLRSPWVGLTLNSLALLFASREGKPLNLLTAAESDAAARLSAEEQQRLQHLISVLNWANRTRDRLSLPIWIEQIWLRLHGPATALPAELTSVRFFFDALRRAEASGAGLNTDRISEDLNHVSMDSAASAQSVKVMTLHKAKGLEFDYVFLPALHKRPRANSRELLRWHWHEGSASTGLLIAADDREKSAPTLYNYLNWLHKVKQHEELKRLLYVGVTRARECAFLSGTVKAPEDKREATVPAGSLLSLLQHKIEGAPVQHVDDPVVASLAFSEPASDRREAREGLYRIATAALERPIEVLVKNQPDLPMRSPALITGLGQDNRFERSVGVVTHRILERLAAHVSLPTEITAEVRTWIRANVIKARLSSADAEQIEAACTQMIANTLRCPRGRWLLGNHPEAHSELHMIRRENGEIRRYVVDRTFFDQQEGVRWVIDYKTSSPQTGENEEDFKIRELGHYRSQLDTYADLLKGYPWRFEGPIKAALYFPAIGALAYQQ